MSGLLHLAARVLGGLVTLVAWVLLISLAWLVKAHAETVTQVLLF